MMEELIYDDPNGKVKIQKKGNKLLIKLVSGSFEAQAELDEEGVTRLLIKIDEYLNNL